MCAICDLKEAHQHPTDVKYTYNNEHYTLDDWDSSSCSPTNCNDTERLLWILDKLREHKQHIEFHHGNRHLQVTPKFIAYIRVISES